MAAVAAAVLLASCASDETTDPDTDASASGAVASAGCAIGASIEVTGGFVVFLEPGGEDATLDAARDALAEVVGRDRVEVVGTAGALAEVQLLLGDDAADVQASEIPTSVRVASATSAELPQLEAAAAELEGVRGTSVDQPDSQCDPDDPAVAAAVRAALVARWQGDEVFVYLDPEATGADDAVVRQVLLDHPDVIELRVLDRAAAHEEFSCLFADRAELVASVDPDDLPISYRVDVGDVPFDEIDTDERVQRVIAATEGVVAVRDAVTPSVADDPGEMGATGAPLPACRVEGERLR